MQELQPGDKIEYLFQGKWKKGILHSVKTHEAPNGIISYMAYLIDTGNSIEGLDDQPEQVEIVPEQVRAI